MHEDSRPKQKQTERKTDKRPSFHSKPTPDQAEQMKPTKTALVPLQWWRVSLPLIHRDQCPKESSRVRSPPIRALGLSG